MNEHTHLLLMQMREKELNRRNEQRRHLGTQHTTRQRTPMRTLTARTLHRLADRLDSRPVRPQPARTTR
ncbi:hypothetical protein [Mumia sp. Pv 4-285]|uniref:hypothetical protein n=1 Tax=Mumia qirimensis TaxID=3234852 RepID=UPI00351D1072